MEKDALLAIGLTKYETEAYLTLLKIGTATAVEIATKSKLHRSNIYDSLNKLVSKGLISHFTKEDVKHYQVEDPNQLRMIIKSKELELEKILPKLEEMQNKKNSSSKVLVYGGPSEQEKCWTK